MKKHFRSFRLILLTAFFALFLTSCGGGGGDSGGEGGVEETPGVAPTQEQIDLMQGAVPPPATVLETTTIQYTSEDGTSVDIEAIEGQVIILFDSDVSESWAESIIVSNGGNIISKIPAIAYYIVSVASGNEMNFIASIRQESNVTFALPDIPLTSQQLTPIQPNEWEEYLPLSKDCLSWYFTEINGPLAWSMASESTLNDIEIGIIEQSYYGLAQGSEDFLGRLQNIPSFPTFEDHEEAVHGTAVTSFAAARGDNEFGNVGVNWWSRIRLISPLSSTLGPGAILAKSVYLYGLAEAISKGSKVTNMSFAVGDGDGECQFDEKLIKSIADEDLFGMVHALNIVDSDFLVVKAAGNENCEHTTGSILKSDNLIIVGASDKDHGKASLSDYGAYIDIAAPGEDLCWIDYSSDSPVPSITGGTSFAAPLVAGAAALLWSADPEILLPNK